MIFARLTTEELAQLRLELDRADQVKWYRRLKIIELSARGQTVPQLALMFDLSEATIRSYLHHVNQYGLAGLHPGHSPGRPKKLTWSQAEWDDLLNQSPCDFDLLQTGSKSWTQALLKRYLALYYSLDLSQGTISKALRAAGVRWRRAKLRVHSPDPLYLVKRERVETFRQQALRGTLTSKKSSRPPPDETEKMAYFAYFDATDLHWCPDVGATYITRGSQKKVNSPGLANPWYALLGSLIYPSGEGLFTIHERKRSVEAVAHLQLLIDSDPEAFWFVVMDNASAHHTESMRALEQENSHRLELVFLPTYSPHLNLIERLWRVMRAQVTRNQFYDSLPDLALAAVNWLEKLPFSQFCSLMGIDEQQLEFV